MAAIDPDEPLGWLAAAGWRLRLECSNPDCARVVWLGRGRMMDLHPMPLSAFRMKAVCQACRARVGVKAMIQRWGPGMGPASRVWEEGKIQRRRSVR